jgi:hypothetical protein
MAWRKPAALSRSCQWVVGTLSWARRTSPSTSAFGTPCARSASDFRAVLPLPWWTYSFALGRSRAQRPHSVSPQRPPGPHHRGDRDRQGAGGPRHPPARPAAEPRPLRPGQLRRHQPGAGGGRAVRPPARAVHRGRPGAGEPGALLPLRRRLAHAPAGVLGRAGRGPDPRVLGVRLPLQPRRPRSRGRWGPAAARPGSAAGPARASRERPPRRGGWRRGLAPARARPPSPGHRTPRAPRGPCAPAPRSRRRARPRRILSHPGEDRRLRSVDRRGCGGG